MKSQNVEIHTAINNSLSVETLPRVSNKKQKMTPLLYKQGANAKRIGKYVKQWLGWGLIGCCIASTAQGNPGDPYNTSTECALTFTSPTAFFNAASPQTTGGANDLGSEFISIDAVDNTAFVSTPTDGYTFVTFSLIPPTTSTLTPLTTADAESEPTPTTTPQTIYLSTGAGTNAEVCSYIYTLVIDGNGNESRTPVGDDGIFALQAPGGPTPVPLFTPIGLIAAVSGLLWFGRRRSMKLKSS